ncbi:MAG: hypothetical protein L0Z62_25385 [Gemmataceae bacterium]|nr:hypothetical protein [Gemmataceae bacterium]
MTLFRQAHGWIGFLPALVLLPVLGCGGGTRETGTVTGKVTVIHPDTGRAQVVVTGKVYFHHPEVRDAVPAEINPDGTYHAERVPVGSVKVTVESPQPDADDPGARDPEDPPAPKVDRRKWVPLPEEYARLDKTSITLEVKQGAQQFDITIE